MFNLRTLPGQIIGFFLFILIQVFLVRNLVLFNIAFCYLYVAYLLMLPAGMNRVVLMLTAFVFGIAMDIFYDTLGINAFACVLMAYSRDIFVRIGLQNGSMESNEMITYQSLGLPFYSTYALSLIFIHHFSLLFLSIFTFTFFWTTLLKVVLSTIFTFVMTVLFQMLFVNAERSR